MASGLLTDWIQRGTHSARPSSPNVGSNGLAIYFETDTGNTFAWTGSAWTQINGGGGGGSTVTYGAGVPTSTPSQSGQLYVATDGWPGMREFGYDGSYVDLPYIVNRGIYFNTSGSGTPAITMERTVTSGNLLLALTAGSNATGCSAASGWTSIYNNSGPTFCPAAAYKYATAADTTESPFTFSGTYSQMVLVLEIANAPSGSPIAASANGNNASITSLTANQLIIAATGVPGTNNPVQPRPFGAISLAHASVFGGSGTMLFDFWAVPYISKYTGGQATFEVYVGGILSIGLGTATVSYWHPTGG